MLGAAGISSLYRGLTVGRMGVVAPISATAPLIPVTVGLARGERPSVIQAPEWPRARRHGASRAASTGSADSARRVASGAGFGLIAAVTFGGSLISLDQAANSDPYWATFDPRVSVAVVAAVLLVAQPRPTGRGSGRRWP